MRQIIPDMISLNINFSWAVGPIGSGVAHEVHLVTRGQDAGIYSSHTVEYTAGLLFDLSAGISGSRYLGSVDQIRYSDYLGDSIDFSGKLIEGFSLSVSHTGFRPTWLTGGYSEGLSAGTAGGISYTYPDLAHKF